MNWRVAAGLAPWICALATGAEPRIVYSKYFKGSVPEYVQTIVEKSGQATFQEAKDDDRPLRFQLSETETSQIFDLTNKLDHFSHPLESPAKVAHTGIKTFRYEDGPAQKEVKFNYSEDPTATLLLNCFERITDTEENYINLERSVKFDRLGVDHALLEVEMSYHNKRLAAPEQFLPLLDRISKNESFMHMSRELAARLADTFRNPPAQKTDKAAADK